MTTMASLEAQKLQLEIEKLAMDLQDRHSSAGRSRVYTFSDEVNDYSVRNCINALAGWALLDPDEAITVVFCSPGGSVFDGMALFDYIRYLRATGVPLDTECLGYAASMGGLLLQAGETRRMGRNAWLMIHEPTSGMRGKASAFKDEAALMERLANQGWDVLAERSTLSAADIKERCHRLDWWLSADEALELGFVDELI